MFFQTLFTLLERHCQTLSLSSILPEFERRGDVWASKGTLLKCWNLSSIFRRYHSMSPVRNAWTFPVPFTASSSGTHTKALNRDPLRSIAARS